MRLWLMLSLLTLPGVFSLTGCGEATGDGPRRYPLSGTITYNGAPLPAGKIYFEPDGAKDNSGPMVAAEIANGTYQTPTAKGTIGGPHIVRIDGYDGQSPDEHNPQGQVLFLNHKIETDLPTEESTQDFTVPRKR